MKRIFLALLLLPVACTAPPPETADNVTDPAVAEAMAEPIMTDTELGQAARDPLGPGDQPATLAVPLDAVVDTTGAPTLGQVAAARVREPAFAGCNPAIGYSAMWSLKFPSELALPQGARLAEAAGSDVAGCGLRLARFDIAQSPSAMLSQYEKLAKKAGFAVVQTATSLSATKPDAAFRADVTAIAGGARIDLTSRTR